MEQSNGSQPLTSMGNSAPKCALVTRFSAIGDVAMSIPVLYSACATYPQTHFVMVTKPSITSIFINKPDNLTVVGVDVKEKYKGLFGLRRLANELVDEYHPDVYIDIHDVLRTKLLRFFCRLRGVKTVKLNKGRTNKRKLTRKHNKVLLPLISSRARYREAFFKAGIPTNITFEGLFGKDGCAPLSAYAHITGGAKQDGTKWVGVAPFAAHAGKIYPVYLMEQVLADLDKRGDCRIFLFGGGGKEKEVCESWAEKFPSIVSLAGKKYGFPAELALLSNLDAMLTMDSANMHLAAIAGTPTVSVWGATHFYCGFKGWHQNEKDMVQLPLPCRPCSVFGDKKCYRGDLLCLNAIRPETISRKIAEKLDSNKD